MSLTARKHCETCRCAEPPSTLPPIAPWPDFAGKPIHNGDRIKHPVDGLIGVVVYLPEFGEGGEAWRVIYQGVGQLIVSRLNLQIGDRGQAIVI